MNHEEGNIVVLPRGYVGRRQPETWSLEKLMDNMNKALALPSSYDLSNHRIERGRGPRNVYTMVVEQLCGNPVVKIYYDWDFPCTGLTAFTDIQTQEELDTVDANLQLIQQDQLVSFKLAMQRAHPDVAVEFLAFATRTGWKVKKTSSGWFVSLRCFVQGRSMRVGDIRRHIDNVFTKDEYAQLDRNVYKETEQCLALVGGHKEAGDKRVLVPLTHTQDLEAFVVQSTANCELMTPAPRATGPSTRFACKAEGPVPQKRVIQSEEEEDQQGDSSRPGTDSPSTDNAALRWIHDQFNIDPSCILLDKMKFTGGQSSGAAYRVYSIPTSSRQCPFKGREHASNHVYFTASIPTTGPGSVKIQMKCHDSECVNMLRGPGNNASVSPEVQQAFLGIFRGPGSCPPSAADAGSSAAETGSTSAVETDSAVEAGSSLRSVDSSAGIVVSTASVTEVTTDMQREAARQSLAEFQKKHPKMDCTVDDADLLQPTKLGTGGFLTYLKNNYYCPLHKKSHDCSDNCVWMTDVQQQLLCRQDMNDALTFPMNKSQTNIIFANINNNININVVQNEGGCEVRDFGGLEDFPQLFSDANLNLLCHTSLDGATITFAKFAAEMVKGRFVFQDNTWYHFRGRVWVKHPGPDDLIGTELVAVYKRLRNSYSTPQQLKWLNLLINDLGNLNKRKPYTEELERHVTREMEDRIPFDDETHLIGFQNGVFDSRDCSFRAHRSEDYLTTLLPYDLPTESDESVAASIRSAIEDIMPNAEVREYLLLLLSLHLEGRNKHAVGMIWTGTGGNGKGVLKDLVRYTFGPLHAEPPATFLTSERPSPERPAPHLVDLRLKRSVFSSEPEAGKKANSAFLKFITGNDPVSCRACHSNDMISYVPRFLVTLLCNVIPLFQGGQEEVRALWRRLKIFHFPSEFVDQVDPTKPSQKLKDPDIGEKLAVWAPEFMWMLVDIFTVYVQGGRRLPKPPAEVEQNLQEQREENSPMDGWLEANLDRDNDGRIHLHRLMKAFGDFMVESGRHNFPTPSPSIVDQKLRALGYELTKNKERQRDKNCYCGAMDRFVKSAVLRDKPHILNI